MSVVTLAVMSCNPGAQTDPGPPPPPVPARLGFLQQPAALVSAGQPISPGIRVAVLDRDGQVVAGATSEITIALASSANGGAVRGKVRVAATNGVATFDSLIIDLAGADYALAAASPGLVGVLSAGLTVAPGPAEGLAFRVQPQPAEAGFVLTPAPQIGVLDGVGNLVTSSADTIAIAIAGPNPSGARLAGTTSVAAVAGIATFTDLRIDKAGTGYILGATAARLSGATSGPITIVARPAPPVRVAIRSMPAGGYAGYVLDSAVTVAILDSAGVLVPSSLPVTLSLGSNPAGGSLAGTTTTNAVAGIATFSDLSIDRAGGGYTLTATAGALIPDTSGALAVLAAVAVRPGIISAGALVTCATPAGGAHCWGTDVNGELGDGRRLRSSTPVPVTGGFTFDSIAVGGSYACGLQHDGAAYCWGNNSIGSLGDGTLVHRGTPVPVSGGIRFASISAGGDHVCGLATDGHAWCWGILSDNHDAPYPETPVTTPRLVSGSLTFTALSAGSYYTCGILADGSAYCFDYHGYGDFSGTAPGGLTFRAISSGNAHVCGLVASGAAYCWGSGYDNGAPLPVAVGGGVTFRSISAGAGLSCGITPDDRTLCWGSNAYGQLGIGSTSGTSVPTEVSGGLDFASVSAGTTGYCRGASAYSWEPCTSTCAITTAGEAWCWGLNSDGQLGDGTQQTSTTPSAVQGGLRFATIATSGPLSCGLTTSGAAYCWGSNAVGGLGDGQAPMSTVPVALDPGLGIDRISVGGPASCGLTSAGEAYCWGDGSSGRLGNGSLTGIAASPIRVSGGLRFATLSAGIWHVCGLTTGGAAWCWGSNRTGQLGDGSTSARSTPVAVAGGLTFAAITTSHIDYSAADSPQHSCGLTIDGTAYCWGDNSWGQLGNGTANPSAVPVKVQGGQHFTAISAGIAGTCALEPNGRTWCWGYSSWTPAALPGNHRFAAITLGSGASCGLEPSGAAWCWGNDKYGQLGNGAASDYLWEYTPVAVSGGLSFVALSTSGRHTCGVTTAGDAWCWGWNGAGQLGNGTAANALTPVRVGGGLQFGAALLMAGR